MLNVGRWAPGFAARSALGGWRAVICSLIAGGLCLGLVVARAPLMTLVAVVTGVALVTASLVEPLVGLGAVLIVGPLRAWLEVAAPGVLPYAGQAALMVVLLAWVVRAAWSRETVLPVPPLTWALVLFLLAGLLSLLNPANLWVGFLEWAKWLQILLVVLIVYDRINKVGDRGVRISVMGLVASGLLQALIGLWQFGIRGEGVEQFLIGGRFYRAAGTFQQPNPYAGMLGLIAALLVGMALSAVVGWWRTGRRLRDIQSVLWVALPVVLLVAGLGASWSRGGWMGFGVAILAMVVLLPRRGGWGLVLVTAVFALGVGLYATGWLPSSIEARLTGFVAYTRIGDVRGIGVSDANYAVMERMAHWQAALAMWRDHFWLGVGLGCYEPAYSTHRLLAWVLPLGHAHNAYLNMAAEVGLVGVSAYIIWGGGQLIGAASALRHLVGWQRGLALGLAGAWVHLAAHSLVDNLLVNNVHLHVGVLAALTAYVLAAARERSTAVHSRLR